MNYHKVMREERDSYRDIFKWGDGREEVIDPRMAAVIRDKFGLADEAFTVRHLPGTEPVKLEKPSMLKPAQLKYLQSLCGSENVMSDDFSRARFSCGKFYGELLDLRLGLVPDPPDAVVAPRTHEEVVQIVEYCNKEKIAVVPAGGRSTVTGAVRAPHGGIALDMTRHMNRVIAVNRVNKTVTVETGIYGPALEEQLNRQGYSCGHFPQSFEYSTVGGWISARGAGQASTGYGKAEDMVVALRVVTPAGVIETRDYPRTAQGWDIHRLFAGAEGTLGVITEATLHLFNHAPENTASASFIFHTFEEAVEVMRRVMQSEGGRPHLFRISDPDETDIAFRTSGFSDTLADRALQLLGFRPGSRCLMFVTAEGTRGYARFVIRGVRRLAKRGRGMYLGRSPVRKWLEQRYSSAYLRDPLMDLGIMTDTLETAVTWDKLHGVWRAAHDYVSRRPRAFMMVHISHVYENGANLYFTFLTPMERGNEKQDFNLFHSGLVETIIAHGGSISHHHGVGRVLAPWMEGQFGTTGMELYRAVKQHLDPDDIMNPGGTLGLI